MPYNLRNRHFLKELDFTTQELHFLLRLSAELKAAKYGGYEQRRLQGKNVALIFEKDSTRTRCAFEVASYDQGARVTYLGPTGSQMGHKESLRDTARVLGRMYDAIEYRGFSQEAVEELAFYASVPVYNGLTDEFHPTQLLCDVLTMCEHAERPVHEIAYCFVGDAHNNMGNSLMVGGCKFGMDVRICGPKSLWPSKALIERCREIAEETGARLTVTEDLPAAVAGVDFVHTGTWVSMGEQEELWRDRIELLLPYRVTASVMESTGVPGTKFMHCLPALHDQNTTVAAGISERLGIDCTEVSDDVFEAPRSVVFDQAENRLHTIKAVMVATLAS